MQANEAEWTDIEKHIARTAFDQAYKREIEALLKQVQKEASTLVDLSDLWRLHDFLSAKRHEVEGKYDYQYSALLFVFAGLVKEGWLHLNELEGLDKDKLSKVAVLSRM
jgi:nucleoside 2-deoxyribosyltransferase